MAFQLSLLVALVAGHQPDLGIRFDRTVFKVLRNIDSKATCSRPIAKRVGVNAQALPDLPIQNRVQVPAQLVKELREVVSTLPQSLRSFFAMHICAVLPARDMPATAFPVRLGDNPKTGVLVVSADRLGNTPNEWLSDKVASFFEADPLLTFTASFSGGKFARRDLIEYVLVHEMSHLIEAIYKKDALVRELYGLDWPRTDELTQHKLQPYAGAMKKPALPATTALQYFHFLKRSSFPSLTAAMNEREAFAESIALYVHQVVRARDWVVHIRQGENIVTLQSCWENERCKNRRQLVERTLAHLRRITADRD